MRQQSGYGSLGSVSDRRCQLVTLELQPGSEPMSGSLRWADGLVRTFTGWLQLSALLQAVHEGRISGTDVGATMTHDSVTSTLRIRNATAADAAAIARIGSVAFPATHNSILDERVVRAAVEQTYTQQAVQESILACAADRDAHFLVAEWDGGVVAYLQFDCAGAEPELHRIYVEPALTGRGIGSQLMHTLEQRLKPRGSYIVRVAAANRGALRFYEHHGFEQEAREEALPYGVDTGAGVRPVPALLLRRELPD
jgi:ribosomal protein S18 acetylase RimI-like enzyme